VTGENFPGLPTFIGWDRDLSSQPDNYPPGADKILLRKSDAKWLDDINSPAVVCGILLEWE